MHLGDHAGMEMVMGGSGVVGEIGGIGMLQCTRRTCEGHGVQTDVSGIE